MLTLLVLLVFALVAAVLSGGSLSRLSDIRVKGLWAAWIALIARLLPMLLRFESTTVLVLTTWLIAFLAVVAVGLLNSRTIKGAGLISAGAMLNTTAIMANGGMPVVRWAISGDSDPIHFALAAPRLSVLTDVLVLRIGAVFSVGDVLMFVGFVAAVLSSAAPVVTAQTDNPRA